MSEWIPWEKRSAANRERRNEMRRQRRAADPRRYLDQAKKYNAKYRAANEESVKAKQKEWRDQNKGHLSEYHSQYYQDNKEACNHRRMMYSSSDLHVLSWHFKTAIEEIYAEARRLTEATGVQHVVDHIYPINHKDFCGLHVPANLRVITQRENDQKGNKWPSEGGSSVLNIGGQIGQGNERIYYLRREGES